MEIADAGDRFQLEQAQEPADMLVCPECDLMAEIDQERLIAGPLESRGLGGGVGMSRNYTAGRLARRLLDVV